MSRSRGVSPILRAAGLAAFAALSALAVLPSSRTPAQAQAYLGPEIVITITRVRALTKEDFFSQADFFAQLTIAGGPPINTAVVKNRDDAQPNWVVRQRVSPGTHAVKLAIFDKDLTRNELIDINAKTPGKRDLDFRVDTRNCRVQGFTNGYQCREQIVRAGTGKKRAEVTFTVDVVR